jgi:hypothetical protein
MLANTAPVTGGMAAGLAGWRSDSVFAPVTIAAVLGLMFLLALGLARLTHAQRRQAAPWLCGYMREADHHRYVAHNFYAEIKRWFRWLGGAPKAHPQTPAKKGA